MKFYLNKCLLITFILLNNCSRLKQDELTSKVVIIQPIITKSDSGDKPARHELSSSLINKAYSRADIDFHFLEPIYFNNSKARDGKINLDSIVIIAGKEKILR